MRGGRVTAWRRAGGAFVVGLALSAGSGAQVTDLGPAPVSDSGQRYSGRVSAIACSRVNPNLYFVAGADGGVWRTTDGGTTWTPLTDQMPTSSMGALALDPGDENVIYAGTGEANYANHSRYGLGVYKSVDGGSTWAQLAQDTFGGRCFSRLLINPQNTAVLYASITRAGGFPEMAAAKGHPGATGPLGVFRSDDGGHTWARLTNGLPDLCATDLAMQPDDPNVLYAGIGRIFGHADNGLYKTVDGGASWTKLTGPGLPTPTWGRVSVAVAPSLPTRVYALITNPSAATGDGATVLGAYRSDDAGATWTDLAVPDLQATYGWYLSLITVAPQNPDTVLMGGVTLHRLTAGSGTWATVTPQHVDMHAADWDASGRLVCGDDGGVHRSANAGSGWTALNFGLSVIQFYAGLSTNPANPNHIWGGTQDNGTNVHTSGRYWTNVYGGDGGWTQFNPAFASVHAEFQGTGNLYRGLLGGAFVYAGAGIVSSDRNCFLPPYLIDPGNSSRMLYASHRIYESVDSGVSWTPITEDITGGGAAAVRSLAFAPSDASVVYASTNDGRVLRSDDGGFNWTLVLEDVPSWPRVMRQLFVHPTDPLTVYLAVGHFGVDQVRRTTDGGQTWETLDGNLPDIPVNTVAVDVRGVFPVIFAGGDDGLYRSVNGGRTWYRLAGLPRTAFIDLVIEPARNRLIAATQGRGAWQLELGLPGDVNCDNAVDFNDISYFAEMLSGEATWSAYYAAHHAGALPPCRFANGDSTGDQRVTFADIKPFVELINH